MRYSIMLQLATGIAFILVGSAAMFAWLQYRPSPEQGSNSENASRKSKVESQQDSIWLQAAFPINRSQDLLESS